MTAFEELVEYVEEQREELYEHIETLIGFEHWECTHPITELVDAYYEQNLADITENAYTTGMPWSVGITYANNIYAHRIKQIEDQIEGEGE